MDVLFLWSWLPYSPRPRDVVGEVLVTQVSSREASLCVTMTGGHRSRVGGNRGPRSTFEETVHSRSVRRAAVVYPLLDSADFPRRHGIKVGRHDGRHGADGRVVQVGTKRCFAFQRQ